MGGRAVATLMTYPGGGRPLSDARFYNLVPLGVETGRSARPIPSLIESGGGASSPAVVFRLLSASRLERTRAAGGRAPGR